jgi:WD40 repeat protein
MYVFRPHRGGIGDLLFTPDSQGLLTSGNDLTVRLWSIGQKQPLRKWPGCAPLAMSPDGRFIASGSGVVRVLALAEEGGHLIEARRFAGGRGALAFAPDGRSFVLHGSYDDPLSRWELPSGRPLPGCWGGTHASTGGKRYPSGGLAFAPDGALLAACFASDEGRGWFSVVVLFDAATGEERGTLSSGYRQCLFPSVQFSPTGRFLAGVFGATICVWDVGTREEMARLRGGRKYFNQAAFTGDDRHLLAVSNDGIVRRWETATWSEVEALAWEIGRLTALDVAPDGFRIAAGGSRGKVVIWDDDL